MHGAASGSHLKLSVDGDNLVVDGWMAPRRGRRLPPHAPPQLAVCTLRGAGAIEVDMGPSGDFVEVLEELPVPLTVHLGDGSDKFIGNGERDTCYSEGARRNRCVGGAGDDICITGDRNSDCVGGAGRRLLQARRRQRRLLGRPRRRRLHHGSRARRLPRRRRRRPALRRPQPRQALRRRATTTTATAVPAGAARTSARPGRAADRLPPRSRLRVNEAAYDRIGVGYSAVRQPEPRIAARIEAALGDAERVLNVGAGTGSYEPGDREVTAVEPSRG